MPAFSVYEIDPNLAFEQLLYFELNIFFVQFVFGLVGGAAAGAGGGKFWTFILKKSVPGPSSDVTGLRIGRRIGPVQSKDVMRLVNEML